MDDLVFIGSGFGIVLGVLAALWGICAIVGKLFRHLDTDTPTPPLSTAEPAPTVTTGTPPAHVAAIAAAVASLPGTWRMVSISAPAHVAAAWTEQGRLGRHDVPHSRMTWAAPGRRKQEQTE